MKQRLISAAIGIPLAIIVLFFYDTILLNISIAAVTLIAVYEIFVATKYLSNRGLVIICLAFASVVPFYHISGLRTFSEAFSFFFILVLFAFLLFKHKTMRFEQIGTVFMLTMLLSFSFSSLVFMRDHYKTVGIEDNLGLFYIVLVFLGAWITDAGAYFVGRFMGKTKLAPEISPKKTVEGAVGGVVITMLAYMAAGLIYQNCARSAGHFIQINYPVLIIAALLCALAAIFGDLSASLIKRECNIKDFGNILPGHGGVLDRFDSVMFVAPLLFIFLQLFPIVSRLG